MNIDIRTVALVVGLSHFIQVLVFWYQYRANPHIAGPGWWLAWCAAESVGFGLIVLRAIPSLLPAIIVIQDPILLAGTVCIYIGIRRFFNEPVDFRVIGALCGVFLALHLGFYFVIDDIQARSLLLDVGLVIVAFASARTLVQKQKPSVRSAASLCAGALAVHGAIFTLPFIWMLLGLRPLHVVSRWFGVLSYFDALFAAMLWTFGFIIMVNQRLNHELQEALEQVKTLRGIVPICAHCKKIRDDKGFWESVERYVSRHTEAQFSHGICPDCIKELYADFEQTRQQKP